MIKTYILSLRPAKLFQTLMRLFMLLVLDHTALIYNADVRSHGTDRVLVKAQYTEIFYDIELIVYGHGQECTFKWHNVFIVGLL